MITVKPFAAFRPKKEYAQECAALPYDVMSSEEAREEVKGKPYSFLHVDKAEIDLDTSVDLYADEVYAKAKENLCRLERDGIYETEKEKTFYLYRLVMDGRAQTGIVGCASIDDYLENRIKKHELTRADKEADRCRHVDTCSAQTGPIFLAYKENATLDTLLATETQKQPLYDFYSDDGVRHTVWRCDTTLCETIEQAFEKTEALYIADGHHRAASAVKAGQKRRANGYNGTEEFNYFLSVIFPARDLKIFDYNRLLYDLNGLDEDEFLKAVEKRLGSVTKKAGVYKPESRHTVGLYVKGNWYEVALKEEICNAASPAKRLDCAILQNEFLSPVLGIADPRTDKRIDFVGGIRGLTYLEKRCNEDAKAAFAMYPTAMSELTDIADAGEIMPPKSTWFEPKLRSGIFIHKI
ncbi:MAG: DUF1015 domain-containing protein [Clostridia bacterium]|nr:DUF1015 domain-containing protein [Clostridia bacterium]